jgi:CDP-diacylglycerol--glycerol-3-phosphate 3-phosphatidyltransferase
MRKDWHNVPNLLGLLRLVLASVPALLIALHPTDHTYWWAALVVFVLLAATDKVDGYVARRFNMQTAWGKVLDPIADKALVFPVFVTLVVILNTPILWVALVIMAAREVHVTALLKAGDYAKGTVVSARQSGRVKMVAQVALLVVTLVPVTPIVVTNCTAAIVTGIALYSWVDYIMAARAAAPRS